MRALTPSACLGLLQAPSQRGSGHESVAGFTCSSRFADYNFAHRHAASGNLEDSGLRPCAGRCVEKISACGVL